MDSIIKIDPKHSLNAGAAGAEGSSLQVKGASSETDSSGRNSYFALQGSPGQKKEEEEVVPVALNDRVDFNHFEAETVFSKKQASYNPKIWYEFSEIMLGALTPFHVPLSHH